MKNIDILVVGGGGREHAIIKKLSESKFCGKLYAAPGNAGISEIAECLPINAADLDAIVEAAENLKIDLVFVAPDDPLAMGLVDRLTDAGIRAFGPNQKAAELESSKVFSKSLMQKYNIPTADYKAFFDLNSALEYININNNYPVFIKADGLALGKGAIFAGSAEEARGVLQTIMEDRVFGKSGDKIIIEEFLSGPELTVLAFVDGETVAPMVSAQDHKRIFDGDLGLNTGGMGAFSPSSYYTPEIAERCMREIFMPTVKALKSENIIYKGIIYFQMMLTESGPKVIEYNARFGDPEAQVVLPRLKTDFIEIINAIIDGNLAKIKIEWDGQAAVCVCMASGGYPEKYEKGFEINGLNNINSGEIFVYHAGTAIKDNKIVTNGGRVLGITARGDNIKEAAEKAYSAIKNISFKGAHYRTDIGVK